MCPHNRSARYFCSFTVSAAKIRMPSAVFSVAIASSLSRNRNLLSFNSSRSISLFFAAVGSSFCASPVRCSFSIPLKSDGLIGQQIASGQFQNFSHIPEASAPITSVW